MNNFLKKAIGKASQLRQGQADGEQGGEQATGEEQPQQAKGLLGKFGNLKSKLQQSQQGQAAGEQSGNQTQQGGLAGKLLSKTKSFNPFG